MLNIHREHVGGSGIFFLFCQDQWSAVLQVANVQFSAHFFLAKLRTVASPETFVLAKYVSKICGN